MRSSLLPQAYGTFGLPDLIQEQLYFSQRISGHLTPRWRDPYP